MIDKQITGFLKKYSKESLQMKVMWEVTESRPWDNLTPLHEILVQLGHLRQSYEPNSLYHMLDEVCDILFQTIILMEFNDIRYKAINTCNIITKEEFLENLIIYFSKASELLMEKYGQRFRKNTQKKLEEAIADNVSHILNLIFEFIEINNFSLELGYRTMLDESEKFINEKKYKT